MFSPNTAQESKNGSDTGAPPVPFMQRAVSPHASDFSYCLLQGVVLQAVHIYAVVRSVAVNCRVCACRVGMVQEEGTFACMSGHRQRSITSYSSIYNAQQQQWCIYICCGNIAAAVVETFSNN